MAEPPRYLPPDVADELHHRVLTDANRTALRHGDGLWRLERLLERAFADGYAAGHGRGYQAGWRAGRSDSAADGDHHLLAVLRAAGPGPVVVSGEQLARPGSVNVTQLTDGSTGYSVTEDADD